MRCNSPFERAGVERVAQRHLQPLGADRLDHEIVRAGAHRRDHIVDAAMGGLHDHRDGEAGFAHSREHAEAVEIGHHQVEHDARRSLCASAAVSNAAAGIAAVGDERLVAELPHHVFDQAALHRVVIGNQNGRSHGFTPHVTTICLEFGALSPMPINALLINRSAAAVR